MKWLVLSINYLRILNAACAKASQVFLGSSATEANDKHGAVASESRICSQIGIDLMKKAGGNAADAVVGTTFCVGVVGMYHSGIGGGGFALARSSNGAYESIDFREVAPAAAFEHMYRGNVNGSVSGGLASGIPGELRGLEYIHQHYGVLPWSAIIAPAVGLAREGFTVSADLAGAMRAAGHDNDFLKRDEFLTKDHTWAMDFAPNGTKLGVGDTMTRRRYAKTLETIASFGADIFYEGTMANATVAAVRASNGSIALGDLSSYRISSRKAVETEYKGFHIASCGVPASGAVALSIIKTVEGYENFGNKESLNLSAHRLDEAMRFGYGKRTSMGDPDYLDQMTDFEAKILQATYAASIRSQIDDQRTQNVSAYNPDGLESSNSHGTSHISTADASGMAFSLTTTINGFFGSHVMVPESGVIMNNQMNDFSIPHVRNEFGYAPSPANYIRPHKRPLSSITPIIISHLSNKTLHSVIGAAGGSRIITGTLQVALNLLVRNMSIHDAIAEARLHDQLVPNRVVFEWAFDNATVAFMKERGHNVTWVRPGYSAVQGIRIREDGSFEAAGDPRQSDSGGLTT